MQLHTAACRPGCRQNCRQSFQWIKLASFRSGAEGIRTPNLHCAKAKVARERPLLIRVVASLPEDSQSIVNGGTRIRTGDTMIFRFVPGSALTVVRRSRPYVGRLRISRPSVNRRRTPWTATGLWWNCGGRSELVFRTHVHQDDKRDSSI